MMELSMKSKSCIGLQILMILMISGCTSGWQHLNPLNDELEAPEFEVLYTDLNTGRESRSPLLDSHLKSPATPSEEAENVIFDASDEKNIINSPKNDTRSGLSDASDEQIRDTRLIAGLRKGSDAEDNARIFSRANGIQPRAATSENCTTDADCTDKDGLDECLDPPGSTTGTDKTCQKATCIDDKSCDAKFKGKDSKCLQGPSGKTCQIPVTTPIPIQTPMTIYSGLGVKKGEPCRSVPSAINEIQLSGLTPEDKKKKFDTSAAATAENFEFPVCSWRLARLQCVPDRVDPSIPVPTPKPDDAVIYPKGTCQCLLGLGQYGIWVEGEGNIKGTLHGKCFIPANKGQHSACGHEIVIPSGQIEYVKDGRLVLRQFVGKSDKFCAPGSECRTGYNYVGLRCSCKKHHKWDYKTLICKSDGTEDNENSTTAIKPSFMILLLPLIKYVLQPTSLQI